MAVNALQLKMVLRNSIAFRGLFGFKISCQIAGGNMSSPARLSIGLGILLSQTRGHRTTDTVIYIDSCGAPFVFFGNNVLFALVLLKFPFPQKGGGSARESFERKPLKREGPGNSSKSKAPSPGARNRRLDPPGGGLNHHL